MKIILYTLALSLVSMSVYADTVTLNNGDRLTGSIVRKEDSNLVFKTSFAGEIKLKWTEISSIKTDKPVVLVLDNDTSIEGASLEPTTTGSAGVRTANVTQSMDIALASVKYINPSIATSGKGVKVSGRINAGASITTGNSDTESYHMDGEVIMRSKTNRFTVGANLYQAKDNSVDTEDKSAAYLKYDHFLNAKQYIYGNTTFARDTFKDQKLKSTIGFGYGHQFWETPSRNLALEGGLAFVNDDYFVAADENYTAGRWAIRYDQKMYKDKIQFFHNHEGLLDLSDTENLTITSQTGFRFPLLAGMNAAIQANIDWDKSPPAGTGSTDRKILFSIGYAW
jgi:putative salt-induced outer membrane protein YdiY